MKSLPTHIRWKRYRLANLLSRQDLATAIGINLRTLQNIEYGLNEPSKRTAEKFQLFQTRIKNRKWDRRQLKENIAKHKRAEIADFLVETEGIERDVATTWKG